MIPYGRQDISQEDIDAVTAVLQSDFLTQGPAVPAFEQAVATYVGAPHGVAVNSATSALHIACMALGVGPGDTVWTSPNTFVASANCARYCGADVDFVDIDVRTYSMCAEQLERKLKEASTCGKLPKVVIPVAFAGQSSDMRRMRELANEYGFAIIEDASHAIGGLYLDHPIGGSEFADITVFSFHPVKIVTTAEGGLCITHSAALADAMRRARSHGITRDPAQMTAKSEGDWYYQQLDLGYNYRMTEMQAALGVSQMTRIDSFVARRHALAKRYDALLADLPLTTPFQSPDGYSGLHLYPIMVDDASRRRETFDRMRAAGVHVNVHYIPVHLQPYYAQMGFKAGDFPTAEGYYARAISLPMFPTLTEAQQDYVAKTLGESLQ
ncbi:UDP-4-amino-4,6-dideoxy-N-acetyl-beta-L-altrosami ne transaminase [Pandoraea sp. NE5]|uniref:UDP-4-amino-4, 6-dideoxy-N-acetyl-beta-L-altrosamine transaminase n=1 Tax=Pandoraea sp. NE5 TaxID=2904129 RepID=UPI0021C3E7F7|nr:UDP-4-amino-4,6-dideoxy-N-acetyl-beta-L-altrosamine transaminase [Pandoraea sp. NE5]BDD92219.1 UDP-4-amino-4,6-dideoxy-N-acetyl-beta-L-altrosami ne transaminase [Pandoraea sp. NE5]